MKSFLPSSNVVENKDLIRDYLSSIGAFKLLSIIGKNDKYINSNSINGLIEDIDSDTKDIYNVLGNIVNIPVSQKVLSNFQINCSKFSSI